MPPDRVGMIKDLFGIWKDSFTLNLGCYSKRIIIPTVVTHISVMLEPKVKYKVEKEEHVFRPHEITLKLLERMLTCPFMCAS